MILVLLACAGSISVDDPATLPQQAVTEYPCLPTDETEDPTEEWAALGVPTDRPILVYGTNADAGYWMPRSFTPTDDGILVERDGLDMDGCVVYGL